MWEQASKHSPLFFVINTQYQVLQASHQKLQQRNKASAADLQTQIQEIFGRGCYWRSCLAPAQVPPQPSNLSKQRLCAWHGVLKVMLHHSSFIPALLQHGTGYMIRRTHSLTTRMYNQQFLSTDEAEQYLLSPSEFKSCMAVLDNGSRAESVKRVIQKSSSLLDVRVHLYLVVYGTVTTDNVKHVTHVTTRSSHRASWLRQSGRSSSTSSTRSPTRRSKGKL